MPDSLNWPTWEYELTHLPLVPHIFVSELGQHWFRQWLVALIGAKPLPELMLIYCQLDPWENISMKFQSEFYHFHSRKCIWNCHLPKWRPFCPGGDELSPGHLFSTKAVFSGIGIKINAVTKQQAITWTNTVKISRNTCGITWMQFQRKCHLAGTKPLSESMWNIFNWALVNKIKWNLNPNLYIFIKENALENVVHFVWASIC